MARPLLPPNIFFRITAFICSIGYFKDRNFGGPGFRRVDKVSVSKGYFTILFLTVGSVNFVQFLVILLRGKNIGLVLYSVDAEYQEDTVFPVPSLLVLQSSPAMRLS
jgi:hypothetical protein